MANTFRPAPAGLTAYTPTSDDVDSVRAWFDRYDAAAATARVTAMTEMAVFPLNLVTDAPGGDAWTGQWDRAEYEASMDAVIPPEAQVVFDSVRTPFFLSPSMVIVFSHATVTIDGESTTSAYADILVRQDGKWRFQTMIQPGWAGQEAPTGS